MSFDTRLLGGLGIMMAVVEAGSFVAAGELLGITQSGVSRAVQRLEERLGIRLFERTSRVVQLTEEGRHFYEETMPLIARLEEAAESASGSAAIVRGRLRINSDPTFARLVLAPKIGSFLGRFPDVSVEIRIADGIGDLVSDGFDVAIRFGEPEPSALIARRLARVRIYTCASPEYLRRRGIPKTPEDLAREGHECILFRDPATKRPFPWEFHQGRKVKDVPVAGRMVVNDALTHLEACLAGFGVAQVMDFYVKEIIREGRLVNLFPDWSDELFPLYAYHPSRHHLPARVRAFVDFVADSFAGGVAAPAEEKKARKKGSQNE